MNIILWWLFFYSTGLTTFYIFCSLASLGSCRKQKRKVQPQNTSLMIIFNRKLVFLFLIYCYLEIKPRCLNYEFVITLSKKICMKNLRIIGKQRKMQTGRFPCLSQASIHTRYLWHLTLFIWGVGAFVG